MLNTFMVYVENKPGVLTRVASLFRRRAFNIDSLTVGRTEKPEVSRMPITVDADDDQARRIEANLYKLVNVLLVENITNQPAIVRDLAMIRVAATHDARSHVLELASVFRARVVDVAAESLTIEITGARPTASPTAARAALAEGLAQHPKEPFFLFSFVFHIISFLCRFTSFCLQKSANNTPET